MKRSGNLLLTYMTTKQSMDFYSTVNNNNSASLQEQNTKLLEHNSKLQEQTLKLHEHNAKLQQQAKVLQQQNTNLNESVSSLSKICQVSNENLNAKAAENTKLAESMKQHAQLGAKVAQLQQHNTSLKETVSTMSQSCQAAEGKLKLQTQLHNDQILTLNSKDSTLTERCKTLAAFAEQHRLSSLRHEQKHTALSKELQTMAAVQVAVESSKEELKRLQCSLKSRDKDVQSLQENIHSLQTNVQTLKQSISTLKEEHSTNLQAVSDRLQTAVKLLKAYPNQESSKTRIMGSLKSSAEVMQLAHTGSVDSMRECLGQVSTVLQDLHGQLEGLNRLSSSWQERVEALSV